MLKQAPSPIVVPVSADMRAFAADEPKRRFIKRTIASKNYAYIGVLGELVWFRYRYGDANWRHHATAVQKGRVDDESFITDFEVKASKTHRRMDAHLMVKQEYAVKRVAERYALVLFDANEPDYEETFGRVMGCATHEEVIAARLAMRNSTKTGKSQGYFNFEIPVCDLHQLPEGFDG